MRLRKFLEILNRETEREGDTKKDKNDGARWRRCETKADDDDDDIDTYIQKTNKKKMGNKKLRRIVSEWVKI